MDELKKRAAERAVRQVHSGMVLGLGTGSTTAFVVAAIGEMWRAGVLENVVGIPTSERTAEQAQSYGLPLSSLREHPRVDLAIDGADEVDPALDLVKGLGGALLREKQVELAAARFIVVVDDTKLVTRLGTQSPLPVEVDAATWQHQIEPLEALGCRPVLRGGAEQPFVTDNGNYILDCRFAEGLDGAEVAAALEGRPGVLAHGLFLGMATEVVVASSNGVRVMQRESSA